MSKFYSDPYTGEQYIPELDWYYLRARNYDAGVGRFASVDPFDGHMTQPLSLNKYGYTEGRPTSFVDPSGEMSLTELMVVVGAHGLLTKIHQIGYKNYQQYYYSEWNEEDRIAAHYAYLVYKDVDGELLNSRLDLNYKESFISLGFGAALYYRGGVYYLAFRGTDSLDDMYSNLYNLFGLPAYQYELATYWAKKVQKELPHGSELVFVGHSLGGGLASAASVATEGRDAFTFNSAGLGLYYLPSFEFGWTVVNSIRAHYIRGEILSYFQDRSIFTKAVGHRISHNPPSNFLNSIKLASFFSSFNPS